MIHKFNTYIFFTLILIIWFPLVQYAQSVEKVFSGKKTCEEIETAGLNAIPKYYNQKAYDSIELVLNYVALLCSESAPIKLSRLLTELQLYGQINDTLLKDDIAWMAYNVRQVQRHMEAIEKNKMNSWISHEERKSYERAFWDKYRNNQMALLKTWNDWSNELLPQQENGSMGELICTLLSGQYSGMYNVVQKSKYKNHAIVDQYAKHHASRVLNRAIYSQISMGISVPLHSRIREILAPKPILGATLGYTRQKSRIEFFFNHRISNRLSDNFYEIERRDTTIFSRETGNFQYGINYAHTLWKPNWLWRINVLGGIGIEHWRLFETLPEYDNNDNRIPANAAVNNRLAPNVSNGLLWQTGLEVQRSVSAGSTWGIQVRYQGINHKPAGTAFFGGMWVVALQWSAFSFGSLSLRNLLRH